jgi:hypothetical protein
MIMPCWSGQQLVIENQYNTSAKPEPYRLVRRPGSKGWTLRAAGAATYRYFERRAALQIDVAVERKVPSSKRAAPVVWLFGIHDPRQRTVPIAN